jgi:uncharacterized SAM-binding protein YcdF (DUF218 family)
MFVFKKVVGALADPLVVALILVLIAAVVRALDRRRLAVWLAGSAGAIAYLCSIPPVGDALLRPLENVYAPLDERTIGEAGYIVVLGSGYMPRPKVSITSELDHEGLVRIVEGVRLARLHAPKTLIVSGGAPAGASPAAIGYAELARDLGIAEENMRVMADPLDTASEAKEIAASLGAQPFVLVTSASHMPRAMKLFSAAGAHPIPAPVAPRVSERGRWSWRTVLPGSGALRKSEQAVHEYLGLLAIGSGLE